MTVLVRTVPGMQFNSSQNGMLAFTLHSGSILERFGLPVNKVLLERPKWDGLVYIARVQLSISLTG